MIKIDRRMATTEMAKTALKQEYKMPWITSQSEVFSKMYVTPSGGVAIGKT